MIHTRSHQSSPSSSQQTCDTKRQQRSSPGSRGRTSRGGGRPGGHLRGVRGLAKPQRHLVEGGEYLRQQLRDDGLRHGGEHDGVPQPPERGPRQQVRVSGLQHQLHSASLAGGSRQPQL